jgi:hypothetical protein
MAAFGDVSQIATFGRNEAIAVAGGRGIVEL